MGFDVRLPLGAFFTLIGALLALYGATSAASVYQRSLAINVNLWWGVVLLLFGLAMLAGIAYSRRARHSR